MSPVALALVLSAAIFHAGWNLALTAADDRLAPMATGSIIVGAALLPAAFLQPPTSVLGLVLLSAAAETAYGLALATAYSRGELSLVYPLGRGTSPFLVTLGGWLLLSERPGPLAATGAVLLGIGLGIVALAGHRSGRLDAVGFAFATGVCISTYSLIDARAVREVSPAGYIAPVLLLQGLALAAVIRFEPRRLRRSIPAGLRIGLGGFLAYLLVLLAFQRAEAGRVSTLREVSVLIGIALSGDRPGWALWSGALFAVCGMVLVAT